MSTPSRSPRRVLPVAYETGMEAFSGSTSLSRKPSALLKAAEETYVSTSTTAGERIVKPGSVSLWRFTHVRAACTSHRPHLRQRRQRLRHGLSGRPETPAPLRPRGRGALELSPDQRRRPTTPIRLDFPLIQYRRKLTARVACWSRVRSAARGWVASDASGQVHILRLEQPDVER